MRASILLFVLTLIASPLHSFAQGTEQFAPSLISLPQYSARAHFEVLLPNADDPVVYEVALQSEAAQADTLSPCNYVISWEADGFSGFSAYFDGNHYRYRNNKLQEYHAEQNAMPFHPNGPGSEMQAGVHATAQFADLIPQMIGYRLMQMAADSTCRVAFHPDTLIGGKRRIAIDGARMHNGYELSRFLYIFDQQTNLPVAISLENSPGSISEQLVDVTYMAAEQLVAEFTEPAISDRWSDAFEKFRQSTFRAESLAGKPLPAFACRKLGDSQRFAHHAGEPLNEPTIIVALNPEVATTQATIDAVREAMEMTPSAIAVIWAISNNEADAAEALLGTLTPDETALISASDLIRNCGIAAYPTLFFVNSDGVVNDVVTGFNNDLTEIVIQKATLWK